MGANYCKPGGGVFLGSANVCKNTIKSQLSLKDLGVMVANIII